MVLTAEVGEGHVAAARAVAAELVAQDARVEVFVCDALTGLGGFLRYVLLDIYRWQLRRAPWVFGVLYGFVGRFGPARAVGRRGLALFGSRTLLRLVSAYEPDVVVSTYPAATSVLGYLRRRGHLAVPACATITDLAGLDFWAHPGIDLHLVMHESCIAPVERVAGAGSVRCVRPVVAAQFFEPCPRTEARQALELPEEGPIVVVSGGGWGVGDIEGAARASLALTGVIVVCLAGRDEHVRHRLETVFADEERVTVLGFTERMSDLLAAADVLVHSTGGVTCLEALTRSCPILAYGAPPGHAPKTARAMATLGLLEAAKSPADLTEALERALRKPASARPTLAPAPTAASLIVAATLRPRPPATSQSHLLRSVAASVAIVVFVGWAFSSDDAYPLVARVFDLGPLTAVSTPRPEVGLVIRAPVSMIPALARRLRQMNAHASFALSGAPDEEMWVALRSSGSRALPELGPGRVTDWLDTRDSLEHEASALGSPRHFFYLVPRSGLTVGQYLLARDLGASPVAGAAHFSSSPHPPAFSSQGSSGRSDARLASVGAPRSQRASLRARAQEAVGGLTQ